MAGQGAGPSRRSHTKSRKGCKTCKRRHIRCDETFPQWCVCHLDIPLTMALTGTQSQLHEAPGPLRLHGEHGIRYPKPKWEPRATTTCLHPCSREPTRYVAADWQLSISRSERLPSALSARILQDRPPINTPPLIYLKRPASQQLEQPHIMDTENAKVGLLNSSRGCLVFTRQIHFANKLRVRFLSIASSYPYVMHALLSFSANHLAWTQSSSETRNLQIHHGSIALRGLHEAIGSFSPANADAILAASLLMLWQATDW